MQKSSAAGGYVMQLQNFSVNDGEGIRTTVFLAGCPLRCQWCCNPEGQTQDNPHVSYMTVGDIVARIDKQAVFYRFSGGGVTFSGGEAAMQPEFLGALASALYDRGISLALESCGWFDFAALRDTLLKMDLVFMDIKHMNNKAHSFFTGVPAEPILENIKKVYALGVPLCIRIPVITGANASNGNLSETFAFMARHLPGVPVELLPYHTFGLDKYRELRMPAPSEKFQTPLPQQLDEWAAMARSMGIEVKAYK